MTDSVINHVSDTALWVAVYRAQESARTDALFKDPLAARLTGERGQEIARQMSSSEMVHWSVVIRTRIIDQYIEDAIKNGIDTVINLGCGLDTRPYRLNLPAELQWVEVDFPHMIQLKEEKLAGEKPTCRLLRLSADLSNAQERLALLKKLGGESKKALILTEGVTPYLSEADVGALADELRTQPSFRYWVLDYYTKAMRQHMNTAKRKQQMRNAPFVFFPEDWFGFFAKHGWVKKEVRYTALEGEKWGRPQPLPLIGKIFLFIFRDPKHRDFQKQFGYVMLEPGPR